MVVQLVAAWRRPFFPAVTLSRWNGSKKALKRLLASWIRSYRTGNQKPWRFKKPGDLFHTRSAQVSTSNGRAIWGLCQRGTKCELVLLLTRCYISVARGLMGTFGFSHLSFIRWHWKYFRGRSIQSRLVDPALILQCCHHCTSIRLSPSEEQLAYCLFYILIFIVYATPSKPNLV